ncbi:hypothetical protein JR316_0010624 [Psilocybe cubensis]|uniref:Uncharacterized protein n=2 Tax=Psilocybe cubensis TaxID=181762 RepID=A0ACB8GLS5_PSICU|nr:hypothetical protein JR316_0010624 [Psilocybe cubensis]KAH9476710.1 hypothetical protein JR316_0010624 [Psilocybe cubensis]
MAAHDKVLKARSSFVIENDGISIMPHAGLIRNKVFPHRIRALLCKTMHDAYKVGQYWDQISTLGGRGLCAKCEIPKTMAHILFKCQASAQQHAWDIPSELWALRIMPWPQPTLGLVLDANLVTVKDTKGRHLQGASRLLTPIRALKPQEKTGWWEILADRNGLQEDWIRQTRVLVGVG